MKRDMAIIITCLAAAVAMFAVSLWLDGGSAGNHCATTKASVVQGPDHGGVIGSRDLSFLPTTDCNTEAE